MKNARAVILTIGRQAASMRVGLVLFGLVMAVSLAGTLVPGWDKLYRSWPFGILLGLLVLNTGFCTLRQAPGLFRRGLSVSPVVIRRWLIWLIHMSVLLVAVGSLWSSLVSRDGSVELAAGETARIPGDLAGGRDWSLTLKEFRSEYAPDGSPEGWWSRVVLSSGGPDSVPANEAGQEISVNHPLERDGLSVLQASWGSRYQVRIEGPAAGEFMAIHNQLLPLDSEGRLGLVLQDPRPGSGDIPYLAVIDGKVAGSAKARLGLPVEVDGQGLRFTVLNRIETSGLMLRYDPAVPLLWVAFCLLGLAVCGVFITKGKN